MTVWDNQQATSWFVGILEGEGSFHSRNSNGTRVMLHNNDKDVIQGCEDFLKRKNILFKVYNVKAGKKYGYKLCISGVDCNNLYYCILPELQCRRNEFQKLLGASETERDLSVDLHWLIGIWEAEGSFIVSKNFRGYLTPKIELDNTNTKIIQKIVITLKELGLSWYSKDYVPDKRKAYTKISIQGVKRCLRFTQNTKDLWRCNKNIKRSTIMLNYCLYRLSKPVNSSYDENDYIFQNQMLQLNG